MKKLIIVAVFSLIILSFYSCDKFLDVVPHDTATVKKGFVRKSQALKFLYTIYSYLPAIANGGGYSLAPALTASDEIWQPDALVITGAVAPGPHIARDLQTPVDPYLGYWGGTHRASNLYSAIRLCNIFLKHIPHVGDMTTRKKKQWAAEVKFLKAYFNFYLIRMYGPIVLVKHNIPVNAPKNKTEPTRAPVDSCFNYVIKLLNEVIHTPALPARVQNVQKNYGRITKSIAYAMKAKVEVYAASPLFNGNKNYVGFKNIKGINPFDTKYDPAKWDSAAVACKQAIDYLKKHNFHLYTFQSSVVTGNLSDTLKLQLTLRNSFALGSNQINPGVIWAYTTHAPSWEQVASIPQGLNNKNPGNFGVYGTFGVPLKIADMFYTNHGVPLKEDKTRNYSNRFKIKTVGKDERFYLKQGYKTAQINFHREPRYYADLDFDGAIHYGNGIYKGGPTNFNYIRAKKGQINATVVNGNRYSPTGYWVKKLLNYRTEVGNTGHEISYNRYNWPIMRLAGLYLLYAEAKNEADGPGPQVYKYLNKVRTHAGIPTVQESWTQYSTKPNQYKTKAGLRKIIHRGELITLVFEAQRYWDLRRWKTAPQKVRRPITGWSRKAKTAKNYYKVKTLFKPTFGLKNYFWPISEDELNTNTNLTQNPGWGQ